MKNFALGRYVPYDSFLHRLDPRNKIFCLIVLMIAVFYSYSNWEITFIMAGLLAAFILALMIIGHVSFRQLFGSLKSMWFIILFLLVINCLIPPSSTTVENASIAFSIGTFHIYWDSILQSLKIIIRLILMLALTMLLTSSTKPLDLTNALEWYMTPLKIFKFPSHVVAMIISLALRLIPTLLEETEQIMKAQASRGVDFKRGGIKMKVRAITSLIVPLFVSSFKRSDELADAMSARRYNPRAKRTKYHKMHWSVSDTFSFIICSLIMSAIITISSLNLTLQTAHFIPLLIISLLALLIIILVTAIVDSNTKEKRAIR